MRRSAPSAPSTQCEPDNRLVARSLENRWEEKLRELTDAEAELAEHVVPALEPSREQLEALARDLPALWAAKTTAEHDRKRLLRALIADVTITSKPERPRGSGRDPLALGCLRAAHDRTATDTATRKRTPPPAIELTRPPRPRSHQRRDRRASSTPPACAPARAFRSTRTPSDGIRRAYKIPATRPLPGTAS